MSIIKKIRDEFKIAKQLKVSKFKAVRYRLKGFTVKETFSYGLNRKNYKNYITTKESFLPVGVNQFKDISGNKLIFSEIFKKYIEVPENYAIIRGGVVCALNGSGLTNANLYDWTLNNSAILKIYDGADGKDINLIEGDSKTVKVNNKIILREEFNSLIKNKDNFLIQSRLKQGEFSNQLYPYTVNTIRLVTAKVDGSKRHKVIAARQRVGTKKSFPADNFHKDGLVFEINIESGELGRGTSFAFKKDGQQVFVDSHPDTGMKISGLKIPDWDNVKEQILNLTENLPLWEFVAWDVVLNDKGGVSLIEMNMKSSLDIFQIFEPQRDKELGKIILNMKK